MPRRKGMDIEVKMRGTDMKDWKRWKNQPWCWHKSGGMGFGYCLGFIGALIYFLQTSTGFWPSILAILKALVWPAFVVYHLLGL